MGSLWQGTSGNKPKYTSEWFVFCYIWKITSSHTNLIIDSIFTHCKGKVSAHISHVYAFHISWQKIKLFPFTVSKNIELSNVCSLGMIQLIWLDLPQKKLKPRFRFDGNLSLWPVFHWKSLHIFTYSMLAKMTLKFTSLYKLKHHPTQGNSKSLNRVSNSCYYQPLVYILIMKSAFTGNYLHLPRHFLYRINTIKICSRMCLPYNYANTYDHLKWSPSSFSIPLPLCIFCAQHYM